MVAVEGDLRRGPRRLRGALGLCLIGTHLSHIYPTGASLYFTVITPLADDPVAQWKAAKVAATDALVATDATITHHHSVGRDHAPWLSAEIGESGVELLQVIKAHLDPDGLMNPGVWDWAGPRAARGFGRIWSVGDHMWAKSVGAAGAGLWSNPVSG